MGEETELAEWFESVSGPAWTWYVKYLSANDTYAKANVHQGGPYVAKEVLRLLFPQLCRRAEGEKNPDLFLPVVVDSDAWEHELRLVWYNSKRLGQRNGRDEARLTRWGSTDAPVVSAESTGSLVVFAYHRIGVRNADALRVWVAREGDHDKIIERVGPVEPGTGVVLTSSGIVLSGAPLVPQSPCALNPETMPQPWKHTFPSGEALVAEAIKRLPETRGVSPDERIMRRRACEFEMFRAVESLHVLPRLSMPFATVDAFVEYAHSVTNRRKSRSGKSLELQIAAIFTEESLSYAHGMHTEGLRKPDFVFPDAERYWEESWPDERLRMLGVKATVKDRWRQILNEARRIETKHLLTLQEGVSENQFSEMRDEGVVLVVPAPLHKHFPENVQPHLVSLDRFISQTRAICSDGRTE